MAIIKGEPHDRPAVKLWNAVPGQSMLHPAYECVYRAAMAKTDLMVTWEPSFNVYCGQYAERLIERAELPTDSPEWMDVVTTYHSPDGDLRSTFRRSVINRPGYEMEYLIKEPADIERLLALPYEPYPFASDGFLERDGALGDAGIVMFGLDHAMYALQRQIGSENFALWNCEHRDLMLEAVHVFAERIRQQVLRGLEAGLRPVFAWVGPELCIPPLMSFDDFEAYVFDVDKPLVDLIHDAGGYVWVHSHGRMRRIIERFMAMGVDVLNPIEPPPMGDITLAEAFETVGERMALEGNIETHDLMTASEEELRGEIRAALVAGRGRRFILCPSSGYMEDPTPTEQYIRNELLYVNEGVRIAEELA